MSEIYQKSHETKVQEELDALVAAENDASKRATLLVLNAINRSLVSNMALTHEVKKDLTDLKSEVKTYASNFDEHARREEAMLNKGRGMWTVLGWLLGVIQVAVVLAINDTRDTNRTIQAASAASQITVQKLDARVGILESKK